MTLVDRDRPRSARDSLATAAARAARPREFLDQLQQQFLVPGLLQAVATDQGWLDWVSRQSYRHPNGFDKLVLWQDPATSPLKLVLHWWAPGAAGPDDDDIHNHRWDFASLVLAGELRSDLYTESRSGQRYPAWEYSSPEGGEEFLVRAAGEVSVECAASITMAAGSAYLWGKDLLHRAWGVGRPFTATLIVQGAPTRRQTMVLGRIRRSRDHRGRVSRLDPAQLRQTLSTLVDPAAG